MCKRADERSSYLLRYVTNQYETEQMSNNTILEHAGTLKFLPDCCKNEEMCDKAVDDYRYALEFVPRYYKPQKICDKAVDTHPPTVKYITECYKTILLKMCNKAVHMFLYYLILFLGNMKLQKYGSLCLSLI